jgi:hypothetical protein
VNFTNQEIIPGFLESTKIFCGKKADILKLGIGAGLARDRSPCYRA